MLFSLWRSQQVMTAPSPKSPTQENRAISNHLSHLLTLIGCKVLSTLLKNVSQALLVFPPRRQWIYSVPTMARLVHTVQHRPTAIHPHNCSQSHSAKTQDSLPCLRNNLYWICRPSEDNLNVTHGTQCLSYFGSNHSS